MHNKSMRGTSFTFPSIKKLKKQLGKTDTFTQYIEMAIRHLGKGMKTRMLLSTNMSRSFLKTLVYIYMTLRITDKESSCAT